MSKGRQAAIADAYRPIVRSFLLSGSFFYLFITVGHWMKQTGPDFLVLAGISSATVLIYHVMRVKVLGAERLDLARLELVGVTANLLIYLNVLTHILLQFDKGMLVYFVLMAMVYSMSGVTMRSTLLSVALALLTLYTFIRDLPPDEFNQYFFVSVATTFASLGIASLLRKAIHRQIEARLIADEMAGKAQTLADHDSLTGLPNRRSIFQKLDALTREGSPFWFGVVDLDGFKSINDSYGHITGDGLLCKIAERLGELAGETVSIGRLAGDEFALFVKGGEDEGAVQELGDRILAHLSAPCEISMLRLSVGGSIGFAHFPTMATTSQQLYERADYALYRAKDNARGRTLIFNAREQAEMNENARIEKALRQADLEEEMYLVFQPQQHLVEDRICGFEALARWRNPVLGLVPPDKFIRAAERAGLIQNLTGILFRKGLAALGRWTPDTSISFNLSARDLADRAFIFSLVAQVYRFGIAPCRIEFEITETAVMTDIETSRELLADLASAGFRIALDDFGSGYSSFEYLDELPLDKVKLDKSFVRKISRNATSREIVSGIIDLCRKLGLRCVVEGVETEEELTILRQLKAEIIQGYLFGKPMTAEDATARIHEQEFRRLRA